MKSIGKVSQSQTSSVYVSKPSTPDLFWLSAPKQISLVKPVEQPLTIDPPAMPAFDVFSTETRKELIKRTVARLEPVPIALEIVKRQLYQEYLTRFTPPYEDANIVATHEAIRRRAREAKESPAGYMLTYMTYNITNKTMDEVHPHYYKIYMNETRPSLHKLRETIRSIINTGKTARIWHQNERIIDKTDGYAFLIDTILIYRFTDIQIIERALPQASGLETHHHANQKHGHFFPYFITNADFYERAKTVLNGLYKSEVDFWNSLKYEEKAPDGKIITYYAYDNCFIQCLKLTGLPGVDRLDTKYFGVKTDRIKDIMEQSGIRAQVRLNYFDPLTIDIADVISAKELRRRIKGMIPKLDKLGSEIADLQKLATDLATQIELKEAQDTPCETIKHRYEKLKIRVSNKIIEFNSDNERRNYYEDKLSAIESKSEHITSVKTKILYSNLAGEVPLIDIGVFRGHYFSLASPAAKGLIHELIANFSRYTEPIPIETLQKLFRRISELAETLDHSDALKYNGSGSSTKYTGAVNLYHRGKMLKLAPDTPEDIGYKEFMALFNAKQKIDAELITLYTEHKAITDAEKAAVLKSNPKYNQASYIHYSEYLNTKYIECLADAANKKPFTRAYFAVFDLETQKDLNNDLQPITVCTCPIISYDDAGNVQCIEQIANEFKADAIAATGLTVDKIMAMKVSPKFTLDEATAIFKDCSKPQGRAFYGYDCVPQFIHYVAELAVNYDHITFYAHNGGRFDTAFLKKYLTIPHELNIGGTALEIGAIIAGKCVRFLDSYRMISTRLADFPKMFRLGAIKTDLPYDIINSHPDGKLYDINGDIVCNDITVKLRPLAELYCLNDCRVLALGIAAFRDYLKSIDCLKSLELDSLNYLTISSLAMTAQVRAGCLDDVPATSGQINRFIRSAIVGGRVMVGRHSFIESKTNILRFKNLKLSSLAPIDIEELKAALLNSISDNDKVSLYPSAMAVCPYPKGAIHQISCFESILSSCFELINDKLVINKYTLKPFIIKCHITPRIPLSMPISSIMTEEGRVFTNEPHDGIISVFQYMDLINYQNAKIDFIEGIYAEEATSKHQKFIKRLFETRKILKKQNNPAQEVVKLILNSIYGKMIMNYENMRKIFYVYDYAELVEHCHNNFEDIVNIEVLEHIKTEFDGKVSTSPAYRVEMRDIETEISGTNYSFAAVMLLECSKHLMHQSMEIVGFDNVMYQDTDSSYIPRSCLPKLEAAGLIGSDLGQSHDDLDRFEFRFNPTEKGQPCIIQMADFRGKKQKIIRLLYTHDNKPIDEKDEELKAGTIRMKYIATMKGIPSDCCYTDKTQVELSPEMLLFIENDASHPAKFDLVHKGDKEMCSFAISKSGLVHQREEFTRMAKSARFHDERYDIIDDNGNIITIVKPDTL